MNPSLLLFAYVDLLQISASDSGPNHKEIKRQIKVCFLSACSELGSASGGPAPPPAAAAGGGGGAGAWMPGSTAGPGPVPPPARGWVERVELDAAVALSQLAHSAQGHCPPAPPILVSSAAGAPGPALAATLLKPPPASPSCT